MNPDRTDHLLSRRRFLTGLATLTASGLAEMLTGCAPQVANPAADDPTDPKTTPTPRSQTTDTPYETPFPKPTAIPSPTPSPTVDPDLPLFDASVLTPVYVAHDPSVRDYPMLVPFDPDTSYPEMPYTPGATTQRNDAYRLVRDALRLFHPAGFGSPDWNPLGDVIHPGDRVLIKPNLVHDAEWANGQTTHPAHLRPIIDYAFKACGPSGSIAIGDGPWAVEVFERVVSVTGIRDMVTSLARDHGVPVILLDLNQTGPDETPLVDMGELSELHAVDRTWYDGHGEVLYAGGDPGIGSYRIAPSVLQADVVINAPKAKVHCSGGITVAMKNMVGIIPAWDGPHGDGQLKECAHTSDVDHTSGKRGMYLDNDTIWRSMADLNRILLYGDGQGMINATRQRRYLAIVDAIVAAEASQYNPVPHPLGTVIVGTDPISVDAVTARCMGFDPRRLKSVVNAAQRRELTLGTADPGRVRVVTSDGATLSSSFRQALVPERYIYSWEGSLEATDFSAPEIVASRWDPTEAVLRVRLRDETGVAWARAAYTSGGERRVKDLALVDGSPNEGEWATPFPLGAEVRQIDLVAGDDLFNEQSQTIAW